MREADDWIRKTAAGELTWKRVAQRSYHAVDAEGLAIALDYESSRQLHRIAFSKDKKPVGTRRSERPPSDLAELWAAIEAVRANSWPADWAPEGATIKRFTEPVIEPRLAIDLERGHLCDRVRFGPYHVELTEVADVPHTIRYSFRLLARPAKDAPPVVVISHEIGMSKGIWVVHVGSELGRTAGDAPIWVAYDDFRRGAQQLLSNELLDSKQ